MYYYFHFKILKKNSKSSQFVNVVVMEENFSGGKIGIGKVDFSDWMALGYWGYKYGREGFK